MERGFDQALDAAQRLSEAGRHAGWPSGRRTHRGEPPGARAQGVRERGGLGRERHGWPGVELIGALATGAGLALAAPRCRPRAVLAVTRKGEEEGSEGTAAKGLRRSTLRERTSKGGRGDLHAR